MKTVGDEEMKFAVGKIRDGQGAAFVKKHYSGVFATVASRVRGCRGLDAAEAEDVAAEAVERSLGYLAGRKAVEAWREEDWRALALWKGHRLALDACRRAKIRPQLYLDGAGSADPDDGVGADSPLVSAVSVDGWRAERADEVARTCLREEAAGLRRLFDQVGLKDPRLAYEILLDFFRGDVDRCEVCRRHGISSSYPYVLLHRIRKAAGRLGPATLAA